jgi:hypothetical protein
MSVLEDIEKNRTDVHFDTYTTTWREIIGQFKDNELIIDPEYQRLFRWSLDQQTQYIESILLGIPSPPLFLAQNKDGKAEVIDGLQRVSTLLKFFAEEVFGPGEGQSEPANEHNQNKIEVPSVLVEAPIIGSLEGFTARTLPEQLARTIRYARITIIILEKESSVRARYEVFRRLNKFGSPLSDQEIRNCTSRLFGGNFPVQLRTLAQVPAIRQAITLSEDAEKEMGVEETILRLLAFNFSPTPLKHEIRQYLDDFMVLASEGKFKLTDDIEKQITATFELINQALPDGSAFRFTRGGFSTNLFDIVATGVFRNLKTLDATSLKKLYGSLIKSEELKDLIGAGSNTRKKLQGRVDLGKHWFKQ